MDRTSLSKWMAVVALAGLAMSAMTATKTKVARAAAAQLSVLHRSRRLLLVP